MLFLEPQQLRQEIIADHPRVLCQVFIQYDINGGQCRSTGNRVPGVGVAMHVNRGETSIALPSLGHT
ncbi:hypothetical protein D3C86_1980070 [compost metagenome]